MKGLGENFIPQHSQRLRASARVLIAESMRGDLGEEIEHDGADDDERDARDGGQV
jgi:hypothetical protein